MFLYRLAIILWLIHLAVSAKPLAMAGDWPQFMRDSEHSGNAPEERLAMPLNLLAQIKLDDAVSTSPAVVAGKVFVVDQMGTAYCVDAKAGRIVWRSAPEGEAALGSNTSSPCVGRVRVFYGTTAGNLHILDTRTGERIRSIAFGRPILGSITLANDSIYLQTLDAVVHCLDLEGNTRWRWDHYDLGARPLDPQTKSLSENRRGLAHFAESSEQNVPVPFSANGFRIGSEAHYGGVAVSVSGRRVVMAVGYDLVCVEDLATRARHLWTRRQPISDSYLPVGTGIGEDFVYCSFPGKDGNGAFLRIRLRDGAFDKETDVLRNQWAVLASPAVRHGTVYFSRQAFGVTSHRFDSRDPDLWRSFRDDPESLTPSLCSPALSRDHCLFTTLNGELVGVSLAARGQGLDSPSAEAFRFQTPHGSVITSSPAISNGRVYFGSDDGHLYVLGSGKSIRPTLEPLTVHRRHSTVAPAGQRRYAWPSAFGGPRNANFVDDPGLKPPFKVRWAAYSGGLFKHPVCATEEDVIYCTLGGLVASREQQTGRIRWRRKLPKQVWTRATLLCADGRIYVPRMFSLRYPKVRDRAGAMYCLDGQTGKILWESPIGIGDRLRASPVFADGVVAFGSLWTEPRIGRPVIPQGAVWQYLVGSEPPENWTRPDFQPRGWKSGPAGFGYGDDDDRTKLDMEGRYTRAYIRKTFSAKGLDDDEMGLMVSYDDGFIAYLNGREVARAGVTSGSRDGASGVESHEADRFEYFPVRNWRESIQPEGNVIALEGHNVNITSSDFSLHAYLVVGPYQEPAGQAVDAWDAATGRRLWRVTLNSSGKRLNGPAGCAGDGTMFFAGGGESSNATGETVAIVPRTGEILWRTGQAYASQTGTPAFQDGKIYLPGTYELPLACLSAADGSIIWQQEEGRRHWYVDTLSLGPDYFTVNNKYTGGAKRWNLADGTLAGIPGKPIQLWGPAHGCGSVVLLSEGMALGATIQGLYIVNSLTGAILWKSPGFASYTCPNPIVSNGRIFYGPQVSGILYCFEPVSARTSTGVH